MSFDRSVLIVRLFCAIFLALLGGIFIFANEASPPRVLGAVLAAIGLTALYLVWLGGKSK